MISNNVSTSDIFVEIKTDIVIFLSPWYRPLIQNAIWNLKIHLRMLSASKIMKDVEKSFQNE